MRVVGFREGVPAGAIGDEEQIARSGRVGGRFKRIASFQLGFAQSQICNGKCCVAQTESKRIERRGRAFPVA